VTPATPMGAPVVGVKAVDWPKGPEPVGNALTRFTTLFNLTGNPAVTIPVERDDRGLPVGIQLISAPFRDRQLLGWAHEFEETVPGAGIPHDL